MKRLTPNTKHQIRNTSPFRALLVVAVGFVFLLLVLRTVAVEPFGVPTGSMAPALSGHHRDGVCPRCGWTVRVGMPAAHNPKHFDRAACQNCEQVTSLAGARDLSGDRLLVDKNIYDLRRPRRWEMVVFRCPNPNPTEFGKPYVKRLVGLPGETITLREGDVYADGQLLRKGIEEVRETLMPVFDMSCAPNTPGGWSVRWVTETDPRLPAGTAPDAPAPAVEDGALTLDASETPQTTAAVRYRHWDLDSRKVRPVRVWNAYDGGVPHLDDLPAAHDFYLTCEVEVLAVAGGAAGEAGFEVMLTDGADRVTAELSVGPKASGRAQLTHEGHGGLGTASGVALEPKRKYRLEFAFVDRRATLALDGRVVVPPADLEAAGTRLPVDRPLRLGARGCRIVIRDLRLCRDIHYTADARDLHGPRQPAVLGAGEYFVLGDNSGNSEDSRKWPTPAVPEAAFIGKPFLIHQPLRLARVSVGGRERVFQTLDWSRLRWLH